MNRADERTERFIYDSDEHHYMILIFILTPSRDV